MIQAFLIDVIVLRQERVVSVPLNLVGTVKGTSVILCDGCIQLVSPGEVRIGNPRPAVTNQICVISLHSQNAVLTVIPAAQKSCIACRSRARHVMSMHYEHSLIALNSRIIALTPKLIDSIAGQTPQAVLQHPLQVVYVQMSIASVKDEQTGNPS